MELDELKKLWKETPIENKPIKNIMEFIQQKNYGPLAALKTTYRKQIRLMMLIPLMLIAVNMKDIDKVLTSVLFWSYVAFCIGIILFAHYNYKLVKSMQEADGMVKSNLERQISLLEKRASLEVRGMRLVFLFFVLLLEVVPYFQHYRMLDKWHSLSLPVRIGAYAGFFLLQYILNRRLKEQRVGRHIAYLKELVGQMQ
jgi:hypothetical protein